MSQFVTLAHRFVGVSCGAAAVLVGARWLLLRDALATGRWPEAVFLVLALVTLVASLSTQLPLQNVLFAGAVVAAVSGGAIAIGAATGMPFGPIQFAGTSWAALPLLMVIFVFSSRGAGRLMLARWRASRNYGFILIALTTLLVLSLHFSLEPIATHDKQLWKWGEILRGATISGTPWTSYLGWTVTTILALAFATPILIRKKPGQPAPDLGSAGVWAMIHVLLMIAAFKGHRTVLAWVSGAQLFLCALFALAGARTGRSRPRD